MKQYKVKVIQMALKNNKIANSGDPVTEAQLTSPAADLVKQGFIVPDEDSEAEAKAKEAAEAKEAFDKAYEEGTLDADQLDSITKAQICEYAEKHAYKHDGDVKKADLIQQVLKAEKVEE